MRKVQTPGGLDLPPRSTKPRRCGLTHVIDKGTTAPDLRARLDVVDGFVDIWKFGWGTAYLDRTVADKLALLAANDIVSCVGGTLLEIAWAQGKLAEVLDWAAATGFAAVEVSNGVVGMPLAEKHDVIARAAERFTVLAEVGAKSASVPVSAARWREEMLGDLAAGAAWVIAEGRESGTVGLYSADGSVRQALVEELAAGVPFESLIFEAPRKDQQAWLIRAFGSDVNLGNVAPEDVLGVESLRLGLRADTAALTVPGLLDAASAP